MELRELLDALLELDKLLDWLETLLLSLLVEMLDWLELLKLLLLRLELEVEMLDVEMLELEVEMLLVEMLDRLELLRLLLLRLETLELLRLLLLRLLRLETLELELLPDVEMLDRLDALDEDKSSIERICKRSWLRGPGNWMLPVWKFSTSGSLTSPDDRVSISTAWKIVLSGNVRVMVVTAPPSRLSTVSAGVVSSPARCMRRMVKRRPLRDAATPR
jgi:hypothetical protein